MGSLKRCGLTSILSLVLCAAGAACAQSLHVSPASEGLEATRQPLALHVGGRVLLEDGVYVSQWPGTYFETAFSGREAFFRAGEGDVHLRVTVDGKAISMLRPGSGLQRIGGLSDGDHSLRIDVISEHQTAAIRFAGFLGTPARQIKVAPRARQIEFIGDSHTVGYANTSLERNCSAATVWETTDTAAGIAGLVAARYDADYQVNAISGRGVVRNYDGMDEDTLPQAYPFVLFDKQIWYADADWRPQVIIVALGTNDFSTALKPGERWASRDELTADYETAYAAFLRGLRLRAPKARILVWGADGSEMAAASRRVVARLSDEGDTHIAFVPVVGMNLEACDWHPDLADDRVVATALQAVLDTDMGVWAP